MNSATQPSQFIGYPVHRGVVSSSITTYHDDFEVKLAEYNVHLHAKGSPPANLAEIRSALNKERTSSPSESRDAFRRYTETRLVCDLEADAKRTIIPLLYGHTAILSKRDLAFTQLSSLLDVTVAKLKPDFVDGARFTDLDKKLREDADLKPIIIPNKRADAPIVLNFFLEVMGWEDYPHVVERQACYAGAIGARAMHTLQNHGEDELVYDGNAYCYSATYEITSNKLQIYAHYITAPTEEGGLPHYYMTRLKRYDLGCSLSTFLKGVSVLRNARELAQTQRDALIRAANARVS